MEITRHTRLAKSDTALMQELENEAILLNLANNQYFRLDEDSLRMFSVLLASPDVGAAHATLAQEYEVAAEALWSDLQGFITALVEAGLVTVLDEPVG